MKKIFVSGCYDILHGGHIEFFNQAKALGDRLIVCFASDEILWEIKKRKPSIPEQHKLNIISSLNMVDSAVIGTELTAPGIDFEKHFALAKPDILAVTEDDKFEKEKRALCDKYGVEYVSLPKTLNYEKTSTTNILNNIRTPTHAPLRVDFAGGWLDVPKFKIDGAFIVNCAISPLVSLSDWSYEQNSGMGGSAAWALLNGKNSVQSELDAGVGWQDPAIVQETGVCVWRSGDLPVLELKTNPDWLAGRMALLYTGKYHVTADLVDIERPWRKIKFAGIQAKAAVEKQSVTRLGQSVELSYAAQLKEGMEELPTYNELAKKYCGSGHGGYALYLFAQQEDRDEFVNSVPETLKIEPYIK